MKPITELTDFELLDLVAKAAEFEKYIIYESDFPGRPPYLRTGDDEYFNPLWDNDDAFKLLAKFKLSIVHQRDFKGNKIGVGVMDSNFEDLRITHVSYENSTIEQ